MNRQLKRSYKPWYEKSLEYLQERDFGPGAIIQLDYAFEDLWAFNTARGDEEQGMYVEIYGNDIGVEEEPPPIFYVESVNIFSEDLVLLKLIGGTCKQQEYYYPIDGFEACLNFDEAKRKLDYITIIQSSSFYHMRQA